jgi:hypothetical protein
MFSNKQWRKMKPRNAQLFLLLFLCTACSLLPSTNVEPPIITLEDAVAKGYPIYLPANDVLQPMGISTSPEVTLNSEGRDCTYIAIDLPYENKPHDPNDEKPALRMLVSGGCAYPYWQGYPAELSWAVGGQAIRVGEDFVDQFPPIILFEEPTQEFQYVVFSEESLDNTIKLLESMTLLQPE